MGNITKNFSDHEVLPKELQNYRWEWFNVGASVSTNLDPAASIGVNIKKFSLNYNADYTTSLLTNKRSLSHQISLRLLIKPSRFYSGY